MKIFLVSLIYNNYTNQWLSQAVVGTRDCSSSKIVKKFRNAFIVI